MPHEPGTTDNITGTVDFERRLRLEAEAKVEKLERGLKSIKEDCGRGAHLHGMSAPGVVDIMNRIERLLKQE